MAETTETETKPKAKKAKKARKLTKSEVIDEAVDLLKRIEAQETSCQQARLDVDDAREDYKTAKQTYGARVDELRRLARARREKLPLFDATKKQQELPSATPLLQSAPADAPPPEGNGQAPADWRDTPIDDLGMSAGKVAKLTEAGLITLGKFQDHVKEHGDFWWKDIQGMGEKTAEEVADRMADWFAKHPVACEA